MCKLPGVDRWDGWGLWKCHEVVEEVGVVELRVVFGNEVTFDIEVSPGVAQACIGLFVLLLYLVVDGFHIGAPVGEETVFSVGGEEGDAVDGFPDFVDDAGNDYCAVGLDDPSFVALPADVIVVVCRDVDGIIFERGESGAGAVGGDEGAFALFVEGAEGLTAEGVVVVGFAEVAEEGGNQYFSSDVLHPLLAIFLKYLIEEVVLLIQCFAEGELCIGFFIILILQGCVHLTENSQLLVNNFGGRYHLFVHSFNIIIHDVKK